MLTGQHARDTARDARVTGPERCTESGKGTQGAESHRSTHPVKVDLQRPKLAAIDTSDSRVRRAIDESFLSGYRIILTIAVGLTIASALSAGLLLENQRTR